MPDDRTGEKVEEGSLEALVEELRSRCEAICRFSGGHTYYGEEVAIFKEFAEEFGLFVCENLIADRGKPDDEGNEHQVWFEPLLRSPTLI